jgi:hypothetical protein
MPQQGGSFWNRIASHGMDFAKQYLAGQPLGGSGARAWKPNAWHQHVKAFHSKNPHLSYKEALRQAAGSYRK